MIYASLDRRRIDVPTRDPDRPIHRPHLPDLQNESEKYSNSAKASSRTERSGRRHSARKAEIKFCPR